MLEVAVKHDDNGDNFNSYGVGFQFQQAVGEHVQLQLESFYVINGEVDDTSGSRAEILIVY
ncbi:MAG TPA: hypothetical protein EYQ57_01845 [Methylococcaceae bacterium]|nr:hypothetical protein [Methylococcaceae bacterium]